MYFLSSWYFFLTQKGGFMALALCLKNDYPISREDFIKALSQKGFQIEIPRERQFSRKVCSEVIIRSPEPNPEYFCFEIFFDGNFTTIKYPELIPIRMLNEIKNSFQTFNMVA